MLRLHMPQVQNDPSAQAMEVCLDLPVLQLAAGRFVARDPTMVALAILHPRKVVVCHVALRLGGSYGLETVRSHPLGVRGEHFSAFSMCAGPFGCSHGEGLCVQSIDGQFAFFDQVFRDQPPALERKPRGPISILSCVANSALRCVW
jgi:hypothetical protein